VKRPPGEKKFPSSLLEEKGEKDATSRSLLETFDLWARTGLLEGSMLEGKELQSIIKGGRRKKQTLVWKGR